MADNLEDYHNQTSTIKGIYGADKGCRLHATGGQSLFTLCGWRTVHTDMCLYPRYVKNPKYLPNKKNGGHPPKCTDERVMYVPIACGVCMECRKQKANEWKVRINEELKHDSQVKFVTLTFKPERLEMYEKMSEKIQDQATIAIRRWLERIRKKTGKSIKHWCISELGQENTERLHFHGLIWGNEETIKAAVKEWELEGIVDIGYMVNERTVNYCVKYILKNDTKHDYISKVYCSAGIGSGYKNSVAAITNRYQEGNTQDYYRLPNGAKMRLPIYYRNMIYTEDEREKLWIQKTEAQKRYVLGAMYDVRLQTREWKQAIISGQEQSERCGYQKPKTFKIKEYEKQFARLLEITKKTLIFAETKQQDYESTSRIRAQWRQESENGNIRGCRYDNQEGLQGGFDRPCEETHQRLRNGLLLHEMDRTEHRRQGIYKSVPAGEFEKTNINNLKNQKNEQARINKNGERMAERNDHGGKNITNFNTRRQLEYDTENEARMHKMQSIPQSIYQKGKGYEIVNIDTGEIYTKNEYNKIKTQLKTISYEKRNRKGTRADGSRCIWYETKRFVRKIGKDQLELFT